MRTIRFTRWQKAAFVLSGLLLVATILSGPYFAAIQTRRNAQAIAGLTRNDRDIQKTGEGIQKLLQFVAQVQAENHGNGADQQAWFVKEITAICVATPGCKTVPPPHA